jgi:hypothetical protein
VFRSRSRSLLARGERGGVLGGEELFFCRGGGVSGAEVDVVVDPAVCEDEGGVGIWCGIRPKRDSQMRMVRIENRRSNMTMKACRLLFPLTVGTFITSVHVSAHV